jgi:hypothetical protein
VIEELVDERQRECFEWAPTPSQDDYDMRGQNLTATVLMSFLCLLFPVSQALAQTILHSFDGDSGPGLAVCQTGVTHCGFPDMNASVNGQQVVQVTWQNIRVYDYNGRLLRSTPMKTFLRDAGLNPIPGERRKSGGPSAPGPFETHVFFDEFINRWVVTATGVSDSLLVSTSPDAMGSWGGVNLGCLQGGPCLDFDPAIRPGYDKNGVYYCGTHLGDSSPNTVAGVAYDCFAVPSAEVQSIAQGTAPAHINRIHNMPHEIFPAVDHNRNKTPGTPAFFLARTCDRSSPGACQNSNSYSFNWIVDTFTWNGDTGTWNIGGEQLVKTDIGSKANKWLYSKPCCGQLAIFPQAGNDAIALRAAESHRLTNLVQFGTHLNGVLGSGPCKGDCGSQGTDTNNLAFWVDLDCSNPAACVVSQTAKISGAFNVEFPSVGVDAAGNVGIVAISSTASTNLSMLLWTHRAADPPNTINGPTTVVAGTQPYTCEKDKNFASLANPVGVMTALDPDGKTLWLAHHWANDATACVWNTRIVGYQIDGPARGAKKPKPKAAR